MIFRKSYSLYPTIECYHIRSLCRGSTYIAGAGRRPGEPVGKRPVGTVVSPVINDPSGRFGHSHTQVYNINICSYIYGTIGLRAPISLGPSFICLGYRFKEFKDLENKSVIKIRHQFRVRVDRL